MNTQELNAVRAINATAQVLPGWTHERPCSEGLGWLREAGIKTTAEAWDKCQNSRWMLWALKQIDYQDSRAMRLYACWCVRHTPLGDGRVVWDLLTDERSRAAVEVAERYALGDATEYEMRAAEEAAREAADTADEASWAAGLVAARAAGLRAARAAGLVAAGAAARAAGLVAAGAWNAEAAWAAEGAAEAVQADQLRRMVANPFAAITTAPSSSLG